jgi:glycosyltransferase involved in cell wall biosynthesis
MRVAFCIRKDFMNPLGGDSIQMLKTKEYLEKNYNILIDIITDPNKINQLHNIVHVFNFSTYKISNKFIHKAAELKIPVVSSPVYWDYSYASIGKIFNKLPFTYQLNEKTANRLRKMVQFFGTFSPKPIGVSTIFRKNAKWMFNHSTIVAPNSQEEADLLIKWINAKRNEKIRIVYNAAETAAVQNDAINESSFLSQYGIPKNYILQVGRIEFCKNQLNLIAALMDYPEIPIVFVGKKFDFSYFKKVNKMAQKRGNVFFIENIPHEEINNIYKFAKIHVLLSLRESPGLVNIEALSNDCPIVISDERFLPVKTYFSNQPYIVNPLNIHQIRETLLTAYQKREINPFDFEKFSWSNVAKQTFSIYSEILLTK